MEDAKTLRDLAGFKLIAEEQNAAYQSKCAVRARLNLGRVVRTFAYFASIV